MSPQLTLDRDQKKAQNRWEALNDSLTASSKVMMMQ